MLTPADDAHHINKHNFKAPFVCGCRDLGEALRRISEGAAMIRTKARPPAPHPHQLFGPQRLPACTAFRQASLLRFIASAALVRNRTGVCGKSIRAPGMQE